MGIAVKMSPEQEDRLEARADLSGPHECSRKRLQPSQIVEQVDRPVRETVRRLW